MIIVLKATVELSIASIFESDPRLAREKIWGHKKHPAVQKEKWRLLQTHVNAT